jgi:hypothetical protein
VTLRERQRLRVHRAAVVFVQPREHDLLQHRLGVAQVNALDPLRIETVEVVRAMRDTPRSAPRPIETS